MYKLTHYKKKKKKKRKKYDSVPKNMWDKGVWFQSKESLGKYNWDKNDMLLWYGTCIIKWF